MIKNKVFLCKNYFYPLYLKGVGGFKCPVENNIFLLSQLLYKWMLLFLAHHIQMIEAKHFKTFWEKW